MNKFNLLLSTLVSVVMLFPNAGFASSRPKLKADEVNALFSTLKTVGGALRLIKMTSAMEDYLEIRDLLLIEWKLKETDLLPQYAFDGTSIEMKSAHLKADVGDLTNGRVSMHGQTWSEDSHRSAVENFKSLYGFAKGRATAGNPVFNSLLPAANAEGEMVQAAAATGLFITGIEASKGALFLGIAGGLEAAPTFAALTLAVIAESSLKAAFRYMNGVSAECRDGKIVIVDSRSGKVIEEASWSPLSHVGAGELVIRQAVCKSPGILNKIKEAAVKAYSSDSPAPASTGQPRTGK